MGSQKSNEGTKCIGNIFSFSHIPLCFFPADVLFFLLLTSLKKKKKNYTIAHILSSLIVTLEKKKKKNLQNCIQIGAWTRI